MLLFWRDVATYRPTPSPGPIPRDFLFIIPKKFSFRSLVLCCCAGKHRPHTYKDDCLKTKKPDVKKPDFKAKVKPEPKARPKPKVTK